MSELPTPRREVLERWCDALVRGDAAEVDRLVHESRIERCSDDPGPHAQPMTASNEEDR